MPNKATGQGGAFLELYMATTHWDVTGESADIQCYQALNTQKSK